MIYLDNSATTYPKPPPVIQAMRDALQQYGFNPGRGGYRQTLKTAERIYAARSRIKSFFGLRDETCVIFTSGCTESLNMVIKGALYQGDHVVISAYEHNAVVRPLHQLAEKGYITYSIAEKGADDDATIENFREIINRKTRMIICTQASNVFGTRLPTERLCALAHANGLLFCLDAAQSAGIFDINVQRDGYDYVCCAGHKYLYGPMGTGLLLLGNDMLLDTLKEGGTGSMSMSFEMPDFYPDRLEAGTLNVPGVIGLDAGIRFVTQKGVEHLYKGEKVWLERLYLQLKDMPQITLYTDQPLHTPDVPVLAFNLNGKGSEETAKALGEQFDICVRGGLHCAPLAHRTIGTQEIGAVRIAPSVFSTENNRSFFINSLRKLR